LDDSSAPWSLVEGEYFKEQAAEYAGSIRRWDEISMAITFGVARNPLVGQGYPGVPGFFSIPIASDPPLILHYFADMQTRQITLLELNLT